MSNPTRLPARRAILAVFILLGLALAVPRVAAQVSAPRPGGGPNFPAGGGGAFGNPPQPGAPGGNAAFGNVPQPIIPGGNGAFGNVPQPGMPGGNFPAAGGGANGNIPGTGNFAGQPPTANFPTGSNFPTIPTGPLLERVWSCEKCGKEVGRGNYPPSSCQHCGVQLINGIGRGDRPTGTGTSPNIPISGPGTGMSSGPGISPITPTTPYVPPPNYPTTNYPTTYNAPSNPPTPTTAPPSRPLGTVLIIIAGVVTGVVLLIVIGIIATVVIARSASKRPARRGKAAARRKRKVRDEDDDD